MIINDSSQICDSDCRILPVNAKFGGATHDAFIWQNDFMQSLHINNEMVWLLGDSGSPQRSWLMTPYSDPVPTSVEDGFNKAHSSARVVIENTFGQLKNRWHCLHRDRTLHFKPEKCAKIILACCVLHNFALKHEIPDPDNDFVFQQAPGVFNSYQRQVQVKSKFNIWSNFRRVPFRLLQMMRSYYEEANNRIMEMNDIRFMYEESPQYEQGYIMGEIIERYRKVVEHTRAVSNHQTYQVFDLLRRVQIIQTLYFEVYHLVRMMHEIPPKYNSTAQFGPAKKADKKDLEAAKKYMASYAKKRDKARNKRKREMDKLRIKYIEGKTRAYGQKKAIYNKWWPIDYGWEIDDNWRAIDPK